MQETPSLEDIKSKIKQIVYETTNVDPAEIGDTDSFEEDLGLDSLTLLEIGVNIDQEFDLELEEGDMKKLANTQVSAELVLNHLKTAKV